MRVNLLRYAGIYIAAAIGLALMTWALAAAFGFQLPTGLSTALPPMLAALIEGQAYARRYREPLRNSEAWAAALRMTLVVAVLNAVVLGAAVLISPELAEPRIMMIMAGVFLLLLGLVLLVNRFFLGMGAKSQLKALEAGR